MVAGENLWRALNPKLRSLDYLVNRRDPKKVSEYISSWKVTA
jgi:hypothetical protein